MPLARNAVYKLQKQQKFVPEKLTAFPPVLKTPIESIEELQKVLLQKSCTQKLQSRKPEKVLPEKWAELNFPLLCKPRFAQNRESGESLSAEMDRISPLIINLKLQSRIARKKLIWKKSTEFPLGVNQNCSQNQEKIIGHPEKWAAFPLFANPKLQSRKPEKNLPEKWAGFPPSMNPKLQSQISRNSSSRKIGSISPFCEPNNCKVANQKISFQKMGRISP